VADERGDTPGAMRALEAFSRRARAWGREECSEPVRLQVEKVRRRAITRERLRAQLGRCSTVDDDLWAEYLGTVETPEEARYALSRVDLPEHPEDDVLWGWAGRSLLLMGRAREAVPLLQRAARSCTLFPGTQGTPATRPIPVWYVRANELLGEALEATHDVAGACAAYAVVTSRWKDATPRSVTLERARARAHALRCDGPGPG
jgi:hypothetical protein